MEIVLRRDPPWWEDSLVLLANSNENNNGCFDSSECTTSANRPYVVMTYDDNTSTPPESGNNSFVTATAMTLGTNYQVNITSAGGKKYFKYTPSVTGFYTFESDADTTLDPYAYLYNCNHGEITSDDDGGDGKNFRLTYHLISGVTYYYDAEFFGSGTGSYSVRIFKTHNSNYINSSSISSPNQVSVSTETAYEQKVYKFTPEFSGNFLFFSSNSITGDPKIWLYDSNMNLVDYNDDGATNSNFWLSKVLSGNFAYYIVVGHYSTKVGIYTLNSLKEATFSSIKLHIRNVGSGLGVKVSEDYGSICQGKLLLDKVNMDKIRYSGISSWTVVRNGDYYTIKLAESNNYLGVSSTSSGGNSIKLYSESSDNTQWKIYVGNNEEVIFVPVNESAKLICPVNGDENAELQLKYAGNMDVYCKWKIADALFYANNYLFRMYLKLQDDNSRSATWRPIIENAANTWESTIINPEINVGTVFDNVVNDKEICGVYVQEIGETGWCGMVSWSDYTMYPTMTINADETGDNNTFRLSVITHEIGHLLGLADNPPTNNSSLMNHSRDKVAIHTPQIFDINNILFLK